MDNKIAISVHPKKINITTLWTPGGLRTSSEPSSYKRDI